MKNKNKTKKHRKHNTYAFLSKMYRVFQTEPEVFVLKKTREDEGSYDPGTDIICIDYRKDLLSTLVHETLHRLHPTWCESRILKEETKIMNSLSIQQVKTMLIRFVKFVIIPKEKLLQKL